MEDGVINSESILFDKLLAEASSLASAVASTTASDSEHHEEDRGREERGTGQLF